MKREEDLIIGTTAKDGQEQELSDELSFEEVRLNIQIAMEVYNFLEQVDLESPDCLRWGVTEEMKETKRKSLDIIRCGIEDIHNYW